MLIGLTGPNASGKGAVAIHLRKRGFGYLSLSDVLREELVKRGKSPDREALIALGNELREREGRGVLATRVLRLVEKDRSFIIDSIRNPGEVEVLREKPDFFLIAVLAPLEARFERIKWRRREKDPVTFDEFLELEKREFAGKEEGHQQLSKTMELADHTVQNDGTLNDLHRKVDLVLAEIESRQRENER